LASLLAGFTEQQRDRCPTPAVLAGAQYRLAHLARGRTGTRQDTDPPQLVSIVSIVSDTSLGPSLAR